MTRKPPHLTVAQSDRVVRALRRRLYQAHEGNVSALAREIGISQPVLSRTMNEKHGATRATAEAIAKAEGVSVDSILSGPRERAIEICREAGIAETALRRVEAEPEPDEFRTTMWWINRIHAIVTLGDGLKVLHRDNVSELARELGVSQSSVWQLMNGTGPSFRTALRLGGGRIRPVCESGWL